MKNSIEKNNSSPSETRRSGQRDAAKRKDSYLLEQGQPSVHRPRHIYPQNNTEWGWYLAGLIDSDGYFSEVVSPQGQKKQPNLTIAFHIKDIHLAYKIRSFINFGTVSKIKNKSVCKYVLTNKNGFIFLLNLLEGKLFHQKKQERYRLLCSYYGLPAEALPPTRSQVGSPNGALEQKIRLEPSQDRDQER